MKNDVYVMHKWNIEYLIILEKIIMRSPDYLKYKKHFSLFRYLLSNTKKMQISLFSNFITNNEIILISDIEIFIFHLIRKDINNIVVSYVEIKNLTNCLNNEDTES